MKEWPSGNGQKTNSTAAKNEPALHSRQLVPAASFPPVATTRTQGDTMDTSTFCQLPNAAATPVTNRLYQLHAPCKMEIVPEDRQNAAGRGLPIDNIDSNRPNHEGQEK
jgi:hypothetical protein